MIENVGNLVCLTLFELGEPAKVVILPVTVGENKPIKYPHMCRASQLMPLNKIDLQPVSAETGAAMPGWHDWPQTRIAAVRQAGAPA